MIGRFDRHTALRVVAAEIGLSSGRWSFWLLIVLMCGLAPLYFTSFIKLSASEDALVQSVPLARNSAYALSMFLSAICLLLAPFTVSVAVDSVVRDQRDRTLPILLAMPVSLPVYLLSRLTGIVIVALLLPLAFSLAVCAGQFFPSAGVGMIPPNVGGATTAFLEFAAPFTIAVATVSFCITVWTGRPRLAFSLIPLLLMSYVVLRGGLARTELRHLTILDPVGFLYLGDLAVGLASNAELNAIAWFGDPGFLLNRFAIVSGTIVLFSFMAQAISAERLLGRTESVQSTRAGSQNTIGAATHGEKRTLRAWPIITAIRLETMHVVKERAMLILLPLLTLILWRHADVTVGVFNAEGVPTTYNVVRQNLWIVVVAVSAVAIFSTVEVSFRDRELRFRDLAEVTAVVPVWLLSARIVSGLIVSLALCAWSVAICLIYQFANDGGPVAFRPILELYAWIALPLIAFCHCLALLVSCGCRSRVAAYAVIAIVVAAYGWALTSGYQHWLYNIPAVGLFNYSDVVSFGPLTEALFIHRLYVLSLSCLLFGVAVLAFARRSALVGPRVRVALCVSAAATVFLAILIAERVERGMGSSETTKLLAQYERTYGSRLLAGIHPTVTSVTLSLDLCCEAGVFEIRGEYLLTNTSSDPIQDVFITANPRLTTTGSIMVDGEPPIVSDTAVLQFRPARPLAPEQTAVMTFHWRARAPDGVPRGATRLNAFTSPGTSFFSSVYRWEWLPTVGYAAEAEVTNEVERRRFGLGPRQFLPDVVQPTTEYGLLRHDAPFSYRATIRAPRGERVLSSGRLVATADDNDSSTFEFRSQEPIHLFAIIAGKWDSKGNNDDAVYFYPSHARNAQQILTTLTAARTLFTELYGRYRFGGLQVAELPQVGVWSGMAFPGLIPMSEDVGFLTRESERRPNINTYTIAHEVAHQWWGSGVWPAHAKGAFILTEGLATYSALMFVERTLGADRRRALFEDMEYLYLRSRRPGEEQPMASVDGSRFSDVPTMYQRSAMVFSMLADLVGEPVLLESLRQYYSTFAVSKSHPTVSSLIEPLASRNPEAGRFIGQFVKGTAVLDPQFTSATREQLADSSWVTRFVIHNRGRGTYPVEVRASDGSSSEQEQSVTISLEADRTTEGAIRSAFKPQLLVIDPEARALLQERRRARVAF